MSLATAYGLALDHLAQCQQYLNAMDKYAASNPLTAAQRDAYKRRRQAFEKMAQSALDLHAVLKKEMEHEKKELEMAKLMNALRISRHANISFSQFKILKENNLLFLLK